MHAQCKAITMAWLHEATVMDSVDAALFGRNGQLRHFIRKIVVVVATGRRRGRVKHVQFLVNVPGNGLNAGAELLPSTSVL